MVAPGEPAGGWSGAGELPLGRLRAPVRFYETIAIKFKQTFSHAKMRANEAAKSMHTGATDHSLLPRAEELKTAATAKTMQFHLEFCDCVNVK